MYCNIVHCVTRSQAFAVLGRGRCFSYEAEYALGSMLHTMQGKDIFRVIPGVFGNISESGNIWDRDFYCTWTVNLTCAGAGKDSFTV